MKKIFIAFLCMVSINCFSQGFEDIGHTDALFRKLQISADVTANNGLRIVRTNWFTFFRPNSFTSSKVRTLGESGVQSRLAAYVHNDSHFYTIELAFKPSGLLSKLVGTKKHIPENGILLLKTKNNKTLELPSIYTTSIKTEIIELIIDALNEHKGNKGDYVTGTYVITEEQLQEIIADEITKVRMECEPKNIDFELKKNSKLPERLSNAFDLIQEQVVHGGQLETKEDVREGF